MYDGPLLLLVLLLVFFLDVVVIVFFVVLFLDIVVIFLFLIFLEVVGDRVQVNGMSLCDFHFRFAFWAAQDFALLDFVFIHVNFGATIGAANHGTILRTEFHGAELRKIAAATDRRII
jgi:hypothetical protein